MGPTRIGLLVFCAEQGFAGGFSERVLDDLGEDPGSATLFLVGTRGEAVARARGLAPHWSAAMPPHTEGIPTLADRITHAVFDEVAGDRIDRLDVLFTGWTTGRPKVRRQRLFPLDPIEPRPPRSDPPLTQVPPDMLLDQLGQDYVHALVCKAALHAFAAENEARMEAMAAAGSQIAQELDTLRATLRRVRQEAITAEIIELGTAAASGRRAR